MPSRPIFLSLRSQLAHLSCRACRLNPSCSPSLAVRLSPATPPANADQGPLQKSTLAVSHCPAPAGVCSCCWTSIWPAVADTSLTMSLHHEALLATSLRPLLSKLLPATSLDRVMWSRTIQSPGCKFSLLHLSFILKLPHLLHSFLFYCFVWLSWN